MADDDQTTASDVLEGISPEVVYRFDDGVFAFEGVSPNIDVAAANAIEARLKKAFRRVEREWFTNTLGLRSVFWRAWIDRLPFYSVTIDGKIANGILPLNAPPWKECGAITTQRPRGFGRKPKTETKEAKP